ncbi:hypothetical protein BH24CHL1_BH24CHL1_17740 [soil metagenome]
MCSGRLSFSAKAPGLGSIEIVIVFLWLAIAGTILLYWPVSRVAALIMVPYLGWVTFAVALTISIWSLN